MDSGLHQSMSEYYSERAKEYDEIYTLGKGPASILDPNAYKSEVAALSRVVERICRGRLIDIACGTAFWLPHYASRCSQITLFDQSRQMLSESQKRACSLGIGYKTSFVLGDFLNYESEPPLFDCALVGFFLSHLMESQVHRFFGKLESILKPEGVFLILDSVWSEERAKTREKEGKQERVLKDGRRFEIYKKYFNKDDLSSIESKHRLRLTIEHFGRVFLGISGKFKERKTTG